MISYRQGSSAGQICLSCLACSREATAELLQSVDQLSTTPHHADMAAAYVELLRDRHDWTELQHDLATQARPMPSSQDCLRHKPTQLNQILSSLLQLHHVQHAARRQGQHQAATAELQDFRQWLDAALQQMAVEQAQLAAELAEDVQQARQQETSAPAEEQTLEGVSNDSRFSRNTLLQCFTLKSGCRWHKPCHRAAGKMKQAVSAPHLSMLLEGYMSIMLLDR